MDLKKLIDICNEILKNSSKGNVIKFLIETLNKHCLWINYESLENENTRIILTKFQDRVSSSKYAHFYNGTVLNLTKTKVSLLALPTPTLSNLSKKSLEYFDYEVYKIEDGTILTLYYFDGRWIISTARAYEANDYSWKDMKYFDVVDSLFKKYDFSWDMLEKNKSYTICVRHPYWHPFALNTMEPEKLWLISVFDGHKISYDNNIGLPTQEKIEIEHLNDIYSICEKAYTNWINGHIIEFGFRLVIKSAPIELLNAQFLIPSTLMKAIEKIFYRVEKSNDMKVYRINRTYLSDIKYILIRTVIYRRDETFLKLFPQYESQMKEYMSAIGTLIDEVSKKIPEYEDIKKRETLTEENLIDNMILKYYNVIGINNSKQNYDLVRNLIFNTEYVELYYKNL